MRVVIVAEKHQKIAVMSTRVDAERPHAHDDSLVSIRLMLLACDFAFRRGENLSRQE